MADMGTKEKLTAAEKLKRLDKVASAINEKAGKKVIGRVGKDPEILERISVSWIPTPSEEVNEATGGGFPRRRTTIIAGIHDSGKTGLALETIAMNQKADPAFVAGWLESENSLDQDFMFNTLGIDPDRFILIEHDRALAGEAALDQVEAILATGAIDMMVINSLKCIVPKEEFGKSLGEAVVGTQARMNARMMRKYTALVAEGDTAFVIITHLTTQIGSMSKDPLVVSGGGAIMFGSSLTLDMRKNAIAPSDPISKEQGIKINLRVRKNHCVASRNPYLETHYFAIFGEGIERYLTVVGKLIEQGVLIKKGAFIRDPDETGEPKVIEGVKYQWQGNGNFREFLKENPDYFAELKSRLAGGFAQSMDPEVIDDILKQNKEIDSTVPDDVIAEVADEGKRGKKK